MRAWRAWSGIAIVVTAASLLFGCSQTPQMVNAYGPQLLDADSAYALPAPGGPTVTAVVEERFANATQQDILFATSASTPGQNMLRIQVFGPVDRGLGAETRLRDGYLPIKDPGSEMRKLIPGVRMQRSPYYVQNKYGPFGYAAGRSSNGDTCFYGWQRIASTGIAQTLVGNRGSIQVRLRLCEQGASERQLLEEMYAFTITTFFKTRNWNPYGNPIAPDASLGRAGSPVYPLGATRFETVTSTPPPVRQPPRRRAGPPRQAEADLPPVLPDPIGPVVPPPPGTRAADAGPAPRVVPALADPPTAPLPSAIVPPPPCADRSSAQCR